MLLDTAIGDVVNKIGGAKRGEQTRKLTQLGTDKFTSTLIIITPLALLTFVGIFSPSTFTSGSLLCQQSEYYKYFPVKPKDCEYRKGSHGNNEPLDPGLCRSRTPRAYLGAHRQFANSHCWNNLVHYEYTEDWVNKSGIIQHVFIEDTDKEPISLFNHGAFPYILIVISALASIPLLVWTHMADDRIQPDVIFFKESLEALSKTLIQCSKSSEKMGDYFKFQSASKENLLDGESSYGLLDPKKTSRQEKLYAQFTTISQFMKRRSETGDLVKHLFYYRCMQLAVIVLTIFYLISASLSLTMSEFTCKVNYPGVQPEHMKKHEHFMTCSILGTGVRLDLTKMWIFLYLLLGGIIVLGCWSDYQKFKNLKQFNAVMGLFRRVWPDKFPERDNTVVVTDLKYLTLLAAGNLSDNPHVYAIFSTLHDAEMEVDTSIRVNDRISVEDVSYDDKWVLLDDDLGINSIVMSKRKCPGHLSFIISLPHAKPTPTTKKTSSKKNSWNFYAT